MRIAYQIKAMLEHAEISIQEAAKLSESSALAKTDRWTASLKTFITLITGLWAKEDLPANVRGLAENVMGLAHLVGLDASALGGLLYEVGIPVKVNIESGGKMNGIPERR